MFRHSWYFYDYLIVYNINIMILCLKRLFVKLLNDKCSLDKHHVNKQVLFALIYTKYYGLDSGCFFLSQFHQLSLLSTLLLIGKVSNV